MHICANAREFITSFCDVMRVVFIWQSDRYRYCLLDMDLDLCLWNGAIIMTGVGKLFRKILEYFGIYHLFNVCFS